MATATVFTDEGEVTMPIAMFAKMNNINLPETFAEAAHRTMNEIGRLHRLPSPFSFSSISLHTKAEIIADARGDAAHFKANGITSTAVLVPAEFLDEVKDEIAQIMNNEGGISNLIGVFGVEPKTKTKRSTVRPVADAPGGD